MSMLARAVLLMVILQVSIMAGAQEDVTKRDQAKPCTSEGQSLLSVVMEVGTRLKKRLLIDPRLGSCLTLVQRVDTQRLSYRDLQVLLALYGFVDSMDVDGIIAIVPDASARQMPLRIIDDSTRDVGEAELVMKIVDTAPLNSASLVPILRPLLPQYAHLVSDVQTNSMIIVGRYGNVRTLEALVRNLRQRPVVAPVVRNNDAATSGGTPAK